MAVLALAWTVGCACTESCCLRIDPTGESLFLGASDTVPPAVVDGTTYAPPAQPAATAPAAAPPAVGNVTAPPVYSGAPSSFQSQNPFSPPTLVGPPVSSATGAAVPIGPPTQMPTAPAVRGPSAATPAPREYVRMQPQRLLAPVGTEVVLRAGICSKNGYLLANQRIEWMLSRDGTGQFVDLNDRGEVDLFRWPWNTPRKVDNHYAIGATAVSTTCLRRGTSTPNDDIQIQRGESWVSVTSATEGTSYVTAYSPSTDDWQGRRGTATIYWIDAQWVFPPSATVAVGQNHTLTTVVTRRSDGAPLAGYTVRYEVLGAGGASLGYDEGSVSDVPTDAQGRASVEVSPTDTEGGTATINVTVLRPAQSGSAAGPELALGRGTVTLNWAPGGVVSTPAPGLSEPAPSEPTTPSSPPPTTPPSTEPDTFTPPDDEPPPGRPELEVEVRNTGSSDVEVGQFAQFEIRVTNSGDGIARGVLLRDEFDQGLTVPGRESQAVEMELRDLSPGDSEVQNITFEVTRDGQLCHRVSVSDDSDSRDFERACVTGVDPTPEVLPTLAVDVLGPPQHITGEMADFMIRVRNSGSVVAQQVTLIASVDSQLRPVEAAPNHQQQNGGRLIWEFENLEVGETREFPVRYECTASTRSACLLAEAQTEADRVYVDEHCIEILPPAAGAIPGSGGSTMPEDPGDPVGPGGSTSAPPEQQPSQPLELSIAASQNPTRAGGRMFFRFEVTNTGAEPLSEVVLRVAFPQEMAPDPVIPNPPVQYRFEAAGNEIRFEPIGSLRAQETMNFQIPVSVRTTGTVTVWGRLESPDVAAAIDVESNAIQILPQEP